MMTDVDVAVVGGGLAGLAAADRLRRAGRRPVVFEATDRVGGRQRTGLLAGQVLEEGAVFFGPQYRAFGAYVERAGLGHDLKTYDVRSMRSLPTTPLFPSNLRRLLRFPAMSAGEKLRFVGFALWLQLHFREISGMLGTPAHSPSLSRLDALDADSYLSARVGRGFVDGVVSPVLQALGFAPATDWSALGALLLVSFSMTRRLHGIPEGNNLVAQAMAEDVDVRHGSRVEAVSPGPAGVELEVEVEAGVAERLRCRDVVLALPAPTAASLVGSELGELLRAFRYSSSLVPAVALRALDTELPAVAFFGADQAGRRLSGIVAEQRASGAPIVSYAAVREPWQYELFDAPDEEIVTILTDVLDEVHGAPVEVIDSKVIRWRAAVPVVDPHTLERRRQVERSAASVPHLAVAGDFMVSPSQEGAVVSGLRAADAILAP